MRAIGYFRLGARAQPKKAPKSVAEFERDFARYCEANTHQRVRTFGDLNASGVGRYPQYDGMLKYIEESGFAFLVAIPDASHLGDDLETVARSFLRVEGAGAKVVCQDDDMPDPLQSAFTVLPAAGVSIAKSDKIRKSMQEKAIRGKGLGRPPYGYRNGADGALEPMRDEAAVVDLIFRLYTREEMGMRLIVQELNERGVTTRRGGKWNVVSVRDILKNPVYIGTYTRFGLRLPGSHEAIIEDQTFRKARDIARERRPRPRTSVADPYLLSGMAFCAYCGNRMMGVTRRQRWRTKGGERKRKTYRYYQCQSRNNQSVCAYHTWRAEELEGATLAQIPLVAKARELERRVGESEARADGGGESPSDPLREAWDKRVRNAERRFIQAMRKTALGAAKTDHLEEAIADLDKTRANAARAGSADGLDAALSQWDELDFESKREFLMTYVGRVEVRDHMATVLA